MGAEHSSCGVGFVASLKNQPDFSILQSGLLALANLEHRGGSQADLITSDGAGIMTDIPHALYGIPLGSAVANLFLPSDLTLRIRSLRVFESAFKDLGLEIFGYRELPVNSATLSETCQELRPGLLMAFIRRPEHCTTRFSFEKLLYAAKQMTRVRLKQEGIIQQFFFASLSAATVVYKALTSSKGLPEFYLDLQDPRFATRFALMHRRFSTNTASSWDKAQPFRVIAHNGEINTISGNRAWAFARERALGIKPNELLTHHGVSDSGSVNEMIEALAFRSSIPHVQDILAIMMPQPDPGRPFYKFWSRAMEPWDGPALFAYSDGRSVGARLDRSGFRPCRWAETETHFYLASEAGSFELREKDILRKGALSGGDSVSVELKTGMLQFSDASFSRENKHALFEPRLKKLSRLPVTAAAGPDLSRLSLFGYTEEDMVRVLTTLIKEAKEPIGSMGDTARLAAFSSETRSLFDFFYQNFAQVTNPPLDYIRERIVTDMSVVLGRRPNIFEPKEMLPPKRGLELDGPVLSLAQAEFLKTLSDESTESDFGVGTTVLDMSFDASRGVEGLMSALTDIEERASASIQKKKGLLILSDRSASPERPPIPSVLAVAHLIQALNRRGLRLRASIVVETGEVRNPHQLAVLIGFGASAVCPYLALELAASSDARFGDLPAAQREFNLVTALEQGLLKIISKMGVSVLQSYQGSGLFTILGLGADIHQHFFPKHKSWMGGLSLEALVQRIVVNTSANPMSAQVGPTGLRHNYLLREQPQGAGGERHSMTAKQSKIIHKILAENGELAPTSIELFDEFLRARVESDPISIRHFLRPKAAAVPTDLANVESTASVLTHFGAGAMSFGAISAEAQRDIILAMREVGGRSNSGEGGENPYYWTDGVSAQTKQIASGRFGVTAEYLINGSEIQIKIAQGAKPGEGGQLMAVKVGPDTAKARFSEQNVDLISPPPMHDIYSIEDLKQLIYEVRQLKPNTLVSVKLVSGDNIGTVAVGVAKAGADIIHIAGHDGGTGAATVSSMKHAGLPWEIGLVECHRALIEQGLRERITLRVDGGLSSGRDVVIAALMGAEEFDFGKLLLIAEGCVMARICEKNTCPAGIATHDPKFKQRYKGNKDKVVALLKFLAEDVRRELAAIGASSLREITGFGDKLEPHPAHHELLQACGLDLSSFSAHLPFQDDHKRNPFVDEVSPLNDQICNDVFSGEEQQHVYSYTLRPTDRATMATLSGQLAHIDAQRRLSGEEPQDTLLRFEFSGSAGQGFAVFNHPGVWSRLTGEANDSVAKSMSGGRVVLVPSADASFAKSDTTILGNCALYGATGGTLYALGCAGDRFGIRNSGATAVVEGVGVQACEYMTRGRVVILGRAGANIGAGMTGGTIFISRTEASKINSSYVTALDCRDEDLKELRSLLEDYLAETTSPRAAEILASWSLAGEHFVRVLSNSKAAAATKETPPAKDFDSTPESSVTPKA